MWWCNLPSDILTNATLSANICGAASAGDKCVAICPNADLSGVGVRSAFYIQSFMNTLLVVFSRRDSVPSTWAATLFTGSLVIAAIVQKQAQTITLHHAILTMNFATLSSIGSLAVAPTLPIWRLSPQEYYARRVARELLDDDEGHQDRMVGQAVEAMTKGHKRRIVRAQSRARLFLAIALLTQVVLQWAWGIVLFVSPVYSQKECSGDTNLIFFLAPFTAREINDKYMIVWVLWLLFSLGITLFMTIILALTSPVRARPWTQRSTPVSTVGTRLSSTPGSALSRPAIEQMFVSARSAIPSWKDKAGQLIFWYNILCILLWFVYIIASEIQIQANCIFDGENSITSFGQITALLLSLAPVWSLTVALYKWPEVQRKLERRKRHEQIRLQRTQSLNSPVDPAAHNPELGWVPVDAHGTVLDTVVPVVAATPGATIAPPAPTAVTGGATTTWVRTRRRGPRGPRAPFGSSLLSERRLSRTSSLEWHELAAFSPHSPG
ncbi:hypothetical protein C8Q80DRAFT_212488 [Daedaleopsis nitida]|nr:hypothetical protein C8Q80DRAFT_212488 [Daedaleopsis nitida]